VLLQETADLVIFPRHMIYLRSGDDTWTWTISYGTVSLPSFISEIPSKCAGIQEEVSFAPKIKSQTIHPSGKDTSGSFLLSDHIALYFSNYSTLRVMCPQ